MKIHFNKENILKYSEISDKGEGIISDENGKHTQVEYYDNLDKVLVQENIIEEIENKIELLTKKNKNEKFIPGISIGIICGVAFLPLVIWPLFGSNPFTTQVDTIFGLMSNATFYTSVMGGVCIPLGILLDYRIYKRGKNDKNAVKCSIEFLKSRLEKEKETLASLKKEKTRNNEDTRNRSKIVDNSKQIETLRNLLDTYYDLGYNSKKYYQYYQQGKLETKLQDCYSEAEIEIAKQYLEEKGPTLVRKKK